VKELQGKSVRWGRTLVLGAALAAVDAYWMTYMEVVWNQGYASLLSIYFNVVFTLALALLVNALVRRGWPRLALTQAELLVLFVMGALATSVAMSTEYLVSALTYPYRYAGPDNRWAQVLLPHLPGWLTVGDPAAVRDYWMGNARFTTASLRAWLPSFLGWGAFLAALLVAGISLCAIVRRQWMVHERLAYPITQIPLLITEPGGALYRAPLLWLGFALAAGVNVMNALSLMVPTVPALPVKRQPIVLDGMSRPWSALNPIYFSANPFLIGLEFFLPLDLLFSIWFFYGFGRAQGVFFSAFGYDIPGSAAEAIAPFVREQAFGSLAALLGFALWTGWPGLGASLRGKLPPDGRWPVAGAAAGVVVMYLLLTAAGMSALVAGLFLAIYLVVTLALTRVRAQYGPPAAGLLLAAPGPVIYSLFGNDLLGAPGLTSLALTHWMGREFAGHPMPHQLEAYKLATERRIPYRGLIVAILLGGLVGYVAAFGGILHLSYTLGQGTAKVAGTQRYFGREAYALMSARLGDTVRGPHTDSLLAIGAGAALTLLLQSLRMRWAGFPFHPVGYALASGYASTFLWSTALLTWGFKLALFRYAGLKGYRRVAPFFLGLILGEFIVGSLISLLGVLLGSPTYVFWPY
jgi:hypothetical protein